MPEFVVFFELRMPSKSMLSVRNVIQFMNMMIVFKLLVEAQKKRFAVMFHFSITPMYEQDNLVAHDY